MCSNINNGNTDRFGMCIFLVRSLALSLSLSLDLLLIPESLYTFLPPFIKQKAHFEEIEKVYVN